MYESFAQVYDIFMDDVPYGEWADRLTELLRERGIEDGLVLDLGCGTGTLTRLLAARGYDMIGVDNSVDMLEIARDREAGRSGILYLLQDMRAFELYGTVRAVFSACDCINYLTEEEDLLQVFRLVNNYLDPGGWFFFDVNTRFKYEEVIGDATIAEAREDCSFIWENSWFPEEEINQYDLTVFVREPGGLYRRFDETHLQRAWDPDRIRALLEEAGLRDVQMFDSYTGRRARARSERILFAAREHGKEPGKAGTALSADA